MNDFKSILNESMKVKMFEEQAFTPEEEVPTPAAEVSAEVPSDAPVTEPAAIEAPVAPEITDELIAQLVEANPVISEVDPIEFKKGLQVEANEHFNDVGGDMNIVAKIVLAHIKETPAGKSYYDALAAMESSLQEEPAEEPITDVTEPGVEEAPAEAPVEEPVTEPVVEESKDKKALSQTKEEK